MHSILSALCPSPPPPEPVLVTVHETFVEAASKVAVAVITSPLVHLFLLLLIVWTALALRRADIYRDARNYLGDMYQSICSFTSAVIALIDTLYTTPLTNLVRITGRTCLLGTARLRAAYAVAHDYMYEHARPTTDRLLVELRNFPATAYAAVLARFKVATTATTGGKLPQDSAELPQDMKEPDGKDETGAGTQEQEKVGDAFVLVE